MKPVLVVVREEEAPHAADPGILPINFFCCYSCYNSAMSMAEKYDTYERMYACIRSRQARLRVHGHMLAITYED